MSIIGNNILAGASGQRYEIKRSLRFNSGDSPSLSFTPSSGLNTQIWTISLWVKKISAAGYIIRAGSFYLYFTSDKLTYYDFKANGQGSGIRLQTNAVFRDPSAWTHIVLANDLTLATATNRHRLYVNGEEVTSFATDSPADQNTTSFLFNSNYTHYIGGGTANNYPDCYLAEIHFVHGSQLAPSNFGKTNPDTGAWMPKKYSGSHGTGGAYLNFSDNSDITATTLGKDSSGNGNNWTPVNFSVSAGAGNDSLGDTPTNNWCTWNPLAKDGGTTYSNGNLDISSDNYGNNTATFFLTSGKWYWEGKGSGYVAAICGRAGQNATGSISTAGSNSIGYWQAGPVYWDGGNNSGTTSYTSSDVIGTALDMDNGIVYFYKNGSLTYTITFGSGTVPDLSDGVFPCYNNGASTGTKTVIHNFGQRAFDYTPPPGFKALNTANLPVPTIKNGTKYMQTVLYTGNATARSITGVGFQPDWTWIKGRTTTSSHTLYDAVRGVTKLISTHNNNAESTDADTLTSFDSDGFSIGADVKVNTNNDTYVAWNWKADGSGSANTDGDITSTVSVNADAGFSIVQFTPTASSGAFKIGHGLNVTPQVIIQKQTSSTGNWHTHHRAVCDTASKYLLLNSSGGISSSPANVFGVNLPDSSTFEMTVGSSVAQNVESIAYLFAEVENYSKFGSYEGNGSSDGTFIYTGFKPSFFMLKDIDRANTRWIIMDNARDPYNVAYHVLAPSSGVGEDTSETYWLADFVSNGVKLRYGADNEFNKSGDTYIFMAFSSVPFKYSTAR